jgi:hypothetical protein
LARPQLRHFQVRKPSAMATLLSRRRPATAGTVGDVVVGESGFQRHRGTGCARPKVGRFRRFAACAQRPPDGCRGPGIARVVTTPFLTTVPLDARRKCAPIPLDEHGSTQLAAASGQLRVPSVTRAARGRDLEHPGRGDPAST